MMFPNRVRRALRNGLVFFLLLGLSSGLGCSHRETEPGRFVEAAERARDSEGFARPPFFRVEGSNGSTILLLGTIHLGPPGGWRLSEEVDAGIRDADRIILEVDLREADEEAVSTLVAERVLLTPPETLDDVISPKTAAILAENEARLAEWGFAEPIRSRMKPWFVAVGLIESTSQRSGLSTAAAVESTILAALGTRPLLGLETLEQQMDLLSELPLRLQDLMLRDTVARLDEAVESSLELADAWRRSDLDALIGFAREGVDEMPELEDFYDVLLTERNQRWMETLRPLLEERRDAPETILVAVGALHLPGPDGLVELFLKDGYRVSQIEQTSLVGAPQ